MVDLRLCTEREVAKALALVLDLDFVDLTTDPLLSNVARLLPQTCERQVEVAMVMCPWCSSDLDVGLCHGCRHPLDPAWHVCPWCRTARQDSSADPVQATG